MNAGRELDALVAEKVMGHKAEPESIFSPVTRARLGMRPEVSAPRVPHYSTDIAAAWEVVEKINLLKNEFALFECDWEQDFDWEGREITHKHHWKVVRRTGGWEFEDFASGITAPHAICLAALKAVGA